MHCPQPRFPRFRPRRLRRTDALRDLVRESSLSVRHLIWPVFVDEGNGGEIPVAAMPGVSRLGIDRLVEAARKVHEAGIPGICIFPCTTPAQRSHGGNEAWNPDNLSNRATAAVKKVLPDLLIMTDVALDPYTNSGHDGVIVDGRIDNDASVAALVRQALAQAQAGADIIGPSDMMDGRIGAIRDALEAAGHKDTIIMSYAAKFASTFYGPFREALGTLGTNSSADNVAQGDAETPEAVAPTHKRSYQIDCANGDEALRMIARDLEEGADLIMVKPGMPCLDVCARASNVFSVPIFAYQVSGEYTMIKAAARAGWINEEAAILESMLAFRRAGCSGILTYFAPQVARLLGAAL